MVEIIIVTHGNYANEIINSVKMIHGKIENIKAITLGEKDSLECCKLRLKESIESSKCNEFLILIDFLGGTPCNATEEFIMQSNVEIVSGVNLPMVLKVSLLKSNSLKDLAILAEQEGKNGIVNVSQMFKQILAREITEDDFSE